MKSGGEHWPYQVWKWRKWIGVCVRVSFRGACGPRGRWDVELTRRWGRWRSRRPVSGFWCRCPSHGDPEADTVTRECAVIGICTTTRPQNNSHSLCRGLYIPRRDFEDDSFEWSDTIVLTNRQPPSPYLFCVVRPPLIWPWEGFSYPSQSCNGLRGPKGPKFK